MEDRVETLERMVKEIRENVDWITKFLLLLAARDTTGGLSGVNGFENMMWMDSKEQNGGQNERDDEC